MRRTRIFVVLVTLLGAGLGAAPAGAIPVPEDQADAEVFMDVDASFAETVEIHRALNGDPAVVAVEFIDKDEAYDSFAKLFASNPDLVHSVTPAMLPASFLVKLADQTNVGRWARRIERLVGVDAVARPGTTASNPPLAEVVRVCTERDYRLEAFLQVRATPSQIGAVRDALGKNPAVHDVQYLNKQAALRAFGRIFKSDPKLVHSAKASDLPVSFRFQLDGDGNTETQVIAQLEAMAGMDSVEAPTAVCDELANLGLVPGWRTVPAR